MWRNLYDELEQERIAVYPIDARGLTTYSSLSMFAQHSLMIETAKATGGQAFYNNNGLKEITGHVLNSDDSFYTLTYSPHDLHFDNKWHQVRMTLNEEGYQLSYRRGYFADGSPGGAEQPQIRARGRVCYQTAKRLNCPQYGAFLSPSMQECCRLRPGS